MTVHTALTSIIMLNRGTWEECTRRALACAISCTEPPFEVIMLDNGSEPEESERVGVDLAQGFAAHPVRLISLTENQGYSGGNNRAMEEILPETRLVCLLNSDCYLEEPGWNRKAISIFDADVQMGALSLTRGEKCHFIDGEFGDAYWFEPSEEPYDCEWINGACLVLDYQRTGAVRLDEQFAPGYWDDTDLSFQIRSRGWAVAQRPDFAVTHLGSRTVATMKGGIPYRDCLLTVQYLYERNRSYLLRKWRPMLHPRLDERESRAFIRRYYRAADGADTDAVPGRR